MQFFDRTEQTYVDEVLFHRLQNGSALFQPYADFSQFKQILGRDINQCGHFIWQGLTRLVHSLTSFGIALQNAMSVDFNHAGRKAKQGANQFASGCLKIGLGFVNLLLSSIAFICQLLSTVCHSMLTEDTNASVDANCNVFSEEEVDDLNRLLNQILTESSEMMNEVLNYTDTQGSLINVIVNMSESDFSFSEKFDKELINKIDEKCGALYEALFSYPLPSIELLRTYDISYLRDAKKALEAYHNDVCSLFKGLVKDFKSNIEILEKFPAKAYPITPKLS